MKKLSKIPVYLVATVMAAMLLAGCQATVDTRWATTQDTLEHWQPLAATLPVEVRGQWPDASREQIARTIPNAVFDPSASTVALAPHFVVEMSGDAQGSDSAYCASPVATHTSAAAAVPLTLTLTLCDGTRVVARSSTPVTSADAALADLPRKIAHLENLALIGIEKNEPRLVETMD